MDIIVMHFSNGFDSLREFGKPTVVLIATVVILLLTLLLKTFFPKEVQTGKLPPHIPSTIPFLGNAINFGKSPLEFLLAAYQKYGPVFSFTMMGQTFTYLINSDASALLFNSKNENLNAEDVYSRLTTPVFGKGVAYDVPHKIFLEQKKMLKTGLNIARFRTHIGMIVEETVDYFGRWGNNGTKDIFQALSELIILTASRCLHGKEIRAILDESVANLYWDLDGGFSHAAWLLPGWLPLPSFRRRDNAHKKIKAIFYKAIAQRRASGKVEDDMLQTLLESKYKTGEPLSDDEIAGMMIGLLLAGQHTSSTTTSWMLFFLAKHQKIQDATHAEQSAVFGEGSDVNDIDYDGLKECTLLDRCMKETLRLRPPIMTIMRNCRSEQNVMGYTIPVGHQVCVSPTTNQNLPNIWDDVSEFKPDRFLDESTLNGDKFDYVPFGAGRHRCIGESFAYVQIKAIVAVLLRKYRFELADGYFPEINLATMIHTPLNPIIKYVPRT